MEEEWKNNTLRIVHKEHLLSPSKSFKTHFFELVHVMHIEAGLGKDQGPRYRSRCDVNSSSSPP
jgi:hypothetical protein